MKGSRQDSEALVSGFDRDETCAEFECGGASSSKDGMRNESNDQPLVFASKQQIDNRLERFDSHVNDSRILQQMGITKGRVSLARQTLEDNIKQHHAPPVPQCNMNMLGEHRVFVELPVATKVRKVSFHELNKGKGKGKYTCSKDANYCASDNDHL